MESIISDKNAMDPEVLVPDGEGTEEGQVSASPTQVLWVGLPRSWALAVFLTAGSALSIWDPSICFVALVATGLCAALRGGSKGGVQTTGAGAWLTTLQHSAALAALGSGVRSSLQATGGMRLRSFLTQHVAHSPTLFSTLVLLFITVLFILGLGRSRLLRTGLIGSIVPTLLLLTVSAWLYYRPQQLVSRPFTFSQIFECTGFLTLTCSGTVDKLTAQKPLSSSSFTAIVVMIVSCGVAIIFLFATVEPGRLHSGMLLVNALEANGAVVGAEWLARDVLAVLATLSLSLSLVEVLASGQRSLVSVTGHILPAAVARDNRWTGTQLVAILITGLLSVVLVCVNSLTSLLMVGSVSHLLSHCCDLLSAVYRAYQPSFVPKHSGEEGCGEGGGSYQLLSDTTRLVESDDSDTELSDDSGHSSDTDIDAVVHEYKEAIKVVTTLAEPVTEPSLHSARLATWSLLAAVAVAGGLGVAPSLYGNPILAAIATVVMLSLLCVMWRQPQQLELSVSAWQLSLMLVLDTFLAVQLLQRVWVSVFAWVFIGLVLWLVQKRRQWAGWQSRLRSRADRARLHTPAHQRTPFSFLPSYRKLTHIDTVHIVR